MSFIISIVFVARLSATENGFVSYVVLKIYSKKCTNGYLKESLRRIARHCRVASHI